MSEHNDVRVSSVGWRVTMSLVAAMIVLVSVSLTVAQGDDRVSSLTLAATPEADQVFWPQAWALLDQPIASKYTIANDHWNNPSGGGAPIVQRSGVGRYSVTWPDFELESGNVQITSIDSGITCSIDDWTNRAISIACSDSEGVDADASVDVLFTADESDLSVWSNQLASWSYTPEPERSNNPGGAIRIYHRETGVYSVEAPGFETSGGHPQVTAHGVGAACQIGTWNSTSIEVRCFDSSRNPIDSMFSLRLTDSNDDRPRHGTRLRRDA